MTDKNERSRILNLYALFGVTIVLTLIPHPAAGGASLVMAVLLILTAFKMRGDKEAFNNGKHSFMQNHAAYILRSIAGVTLLMLITISLASGYLLSVIDYAPFETCAQEFQSMGAEAIESASNEQIYAKAEPCMEDFLHENRGSLTTAMIIASLLPLFYIGWRFMQGITRAYKGVMIDNPLKWI